MTYWEKRQQQLNRQMEKDEEKLKKRLSSYFDTGNWRNRLQRTTSSTELIM